MRWVEPAFANVRKSPGDEVHGVAFHMTVAAMKKLDSQEPYGKHYVTLKAYDGRELQGFVYVMQNEKEDTTPSGVYSIRNCEISRWLEIRFLQIATWASSSRGPWPPV